MGSHRLLLLLVLSPVLVTSVTINEASTESISQAQGVNLQLPCTYTLAPTETGDLDIEWALMNPVPTGLDSVILTYMSKQIIPKGPPELMQRLHFTAADPSQGDASVTITYLEVQDSGTYQCKVKKNPGVASRKVAINVQVKPTTARCWVDGEQVLGRDVILKCQPDQGSQPLTFTWTKITKGTAVPPALSLANPNGNLLVKNISQALAGTYQCSVMNSVGHATCTVVLTANPEVNRAGIIAGAVIGALLLLLLLLLLICCLICCCRRRRYEKEVTNEIREDVGAPPSRNNSMRSFLGYRPHNIVYSSRRVYNNAPKEEASAPSLQGSFTTPHHGYEYEDTGFVTTVPGPSRLAPHNISRIGGVPAMVPAQSREGFIV